MKPANFLLSLLICQFLLFSCTTEAQIYPGETWNINQNPASDGWSENALTEFRRFIIDSSNITGLLIIHKGAIVIEYGDIQENSYIASCRKSVLAMLYGPFVENGTIALDKTLGELQINDVSPLLPIEKKATVKDLISARSGIYLEASNGGDLRNFAPERGSVAPGSHWLYNNWDFNVAGYIFEHETHRNIYDAVEEQLANPLHMQDWDKSLQQKTVNEKVSKFPAYHMWFSTRDMARIGLLMLRKGKWNDQQLISERWIHEITRQWTSFTEAQKSAPILKEDGLDLGYGYMWWLIENTDDYRLKDAYSAQGALGQNITVYPNIDVVLAFKTKSVYRRRNSIQTQMKVIKKAVQIYKPPKN
ncbi:serine hydrolase domain-containing protein [Robertkochia solimangrovi]|uniref:serine hydrolase domain-containing protein n=1 Tax=Robertkochia solimangrovi TaxID=2213046 RepID=UPI00117DFA08|nr:serine hydrolase [Robertkochia solimangrovi]TRZ42424.1 hypothetical protein DMZ48_12985 [Robertkochia solimangrovi]